MVMVVGCTGCSRRRASAAASCQPCLPSVREVRAGWPTGPTARISASRSPHGANWKMPDLGCLSASTIPGFSNPDPTSYWHRFRSNLACKKSSLRRDTATTHTRIVCSPNSLFLRQWPPPFQEPQRHHSSRCLGPGTQLLT